MELIKCKECGKEYSIKGIGTHIWRSHGEGKNFKGNNDYSKRIIWNKGLTKETDKRVKQYSNTINEKLKSGEIKPAFKDKKHTNESKEKMSKSALIAFDNNNHSTWLSRKK